MFGPSDSVASIEAKLTAAYGTNGGHEPANHGQFSEERFAFLFKPGTYDVDAPVGYYTSVLGLGKDPADVTFTSPRGVYSEEQDFSIGGALSTFWRSAENFKTAASNKWATGTGMMWAVSQAAPLRRLVVENDLVLFEYEPPLQGAGESSGGFMANVQVVGGAVVPGSQQQWFTRDSTVAGWKGGVWNMVFTGVEGSLPPNHCGNSGNPSGGGGSSSSSSSTPVTAVPKTPKVSEKPYLTIDPATGKYSLEVPPVKTASSGASFDPAGTTSVPFDQVFVARPTDGAAAINAKLAAGLHVVLAPGIYALDAPLQLTHPGQVLLGLGFATLVSAKQNTLVQVADGVDGVRVAGIILQAGPPAGSSSSSSVDATAPVLLQWGGTATTNATSSGGATTPPWSHSRPSSRPSRYAGNPASPGFLHDVFARVGGPDGTPANPVAASTMVHIHSGNVIGDNLWLWRADHAKGAPVAYTSNRCRNGLVVDGDDVTFYGLAVEHAEQDLTVWNGERGATYFYQSELPYGVTQSEYGDPGYAGYRVAESVKAHQAYGTGVYCFFRDHVVNVTSAIVAPAALESSFVNPLTVFLNGNGGIRHILNDKGNFSFGPQTAVNYLC